MRTPRRASLEIVAVCLATAFLLATGIQCTPRDAGHIARLEAIGYRAAMASLQRRHATDSALRTVDSVTRIMTNRIAANRRVEARLLETLAANDALLADTSRIAIDGRERELFVALQRTTEVARLFRDSTDVLLTSVTDLLSAHEAEREAWLAEREQNTIQVAAQAHLITALRAANRCSFLRIPCPTRKQAAVGGFVVGVLTLGVLIP